MIDGWVTALIDSDRNGIAKPLLSQRCKVRDTETAYRIQVGYITRKLKQGSRISGYKAALTAETGRALFGANEPGSGVLLSEGKRFTGATLGLSAFKKPGLEVEIGYRVKKAITEAVDGDSVMSYIGETLPMVEVVDFGYEDPQGQQKDIHAIDFIAGNCAASEFITGKFDSFDGDVNSLKISLSRDGELLFTGQGSDALGNQLDSLIYLINNTLTLDYKIEPGHYLMTGSLGRLYFAIPGNYVADYAGFGQIHFSCR
jgi:2-keto-4-pentenoate hydratase